MGWVKKRILTLMLVVSLALPLTVSTPVEVFAAQDYLSITLADIIIAWYNASGVAIGDSNVANAIYSAYSGITLADLADHDCLTALDAVYAPGTPEMRAYVKELIGYGNLTVPMIFVQVNHLQQYLGELPASNVAKESLEAMFGWEGNLWNEGMFGLLGGVIGSVANTGKIAYNVAGNTLTDISDTVKNSYLGKTLLDVYRHFTDTTYFQDLLDEEYPDPGGGSGPNMDYTFSSKITPERGCFANTAGTSARWGGKLVENVFAVSWKSPGNTHRRLYFCNLSNAKHEIMYGLSPISNNYIDRGTYYLVDIKSNELNYRGEELDDYPVASGYALIIPDGLNKTQAMQYCRDNNPWGAGTSTITGITKYINNAVGNILSDNYINLSPNIGSDEYMYIFDRPTYIETLNQITNNTDNGDYSQNSTVINNYNTEYVEPPIIVPDRPTSAPAPTGQPVQPTVSPRPTQIPEEVSNIIYEGGISEEITKKFPFCIPWDIKAMIDRLWAPDRRAPYIHWDATFGSWGKLGEVDIDLSDFDNAAAIFRSTTLLLWIVGLVIITKHLIG